jgi:hypothetical protein|uniref:Putative RNA-directed DNA polymerase n=1 Tax=Sipha flava TaxID=143950 RepID=A0A2S2QYQ1_9HEMI
MAEAFDHVWYNGLLHKIRFSPASLYLTIKFFLAKRTFQVRIEDELWISHPIKLGVPQGSILIPTLYNLYTADIPHLKNTTLATNITNDAVIMSSNKCLETATDL